MTRSGSKKPPRNPLSVSETFRAFVLDQLEELGDVMPRSMFGGVGLYRDGLFFGIIAGDVLYLKADGETRADFEAAGSQPFKPYPDRSGTMQYYAVPVSVLESPLELARWGHKAVAAASRANRDAERRDVKAKRRDAKAQGKKAKSKGRD